MQASGGIMAEESKEVLLNGGREVSVTLVSGADEFLGAVLGGAPAKTGVAALRVVKNAAGQPFVAVIIANKHVGFLTHSDAEDLFPTLAECDLRDVLAQAKARVSASPDGSDKPVLKLSLAEPGELLGSMKTEVSQLPVELPAEQPMPDQYCRGCGKGLPADAKFCLECGTPVVAVPAPTQETAIPTPVLPVAPRVAPLPGPVAARGQFSGTPTKGRGWWGRRSRLQKAGVVVGAVAVLAIVASVAGSAGDKDKEAVSGSSTSVAAATTTASVTATTATPTTTTEAMTTTTTAGATTTTTEKEKVWAEVVTLSSNGDKRSSSFTLTGADARLRYTVKGEMVIVGIYVMEKGTSLQEQGGFPEVMLSEAGSDETYLQKSAGEYYLDVSAANCSWTVTIEELR
jgi:hypothetical protein